MIYLFAGDDATVRHQAYEKFVGSLPATEEVFYIGRNDFNKTQIESFYSGAGLFFAKCSVVFTQVLEKEEFEEFIIGKLPEMSASSNDFIFLEGKLGKPVLDAFRKARAELNIFELSKEKKEKFNNFLLANDFGARDKINLWLHFRQAIDKGVGMEELVGVLFWKAKDMMLKRNFSKFTEAELQNFSNKLAYLLPEVRKQGLDDEAAFEQFLLEAF